MMRALLLLALCLLTAPVGAQTFASWVASFGLSGGNATATADPDTDGVPNVIEYALHGMNPSLGDVTAYQEAHALRFQTRNSDGSYNALTTTGPVGGVTAHLVLRLRLRSGTTGIVVQPETNARDLQRWGWGDSAFTSWSDGTYTYYRTISNTRRWGNRGFVRLRVALTP